MDSWLPTVPKGAKNAAVKLGKQVSYVLAAYGKGWE